jgi:peptidoglycan hydrolase-like protein with peptidoglycan-binding domain
VPADGELVHFQLIAPFHDSAAHELDDVNALRNTSVRPAAGIAAGAAVNTGPRQYLTNAYNTSFDATDPQRFNAHKTVGGLRGNPVLGNVLKELPAAGFPGMDKPQASPAPRKHSVMVKANAQGKAGVLFCISRIAGDRYRFRIFLDPNGGVASDGTEKGAVVHETGRFVVWRHVLWHDYWVKPPPSLPAKNTVRGVQARLAILGYDVGGVDGSSGPITQAAINAFQSNYPPLPTNSSWSDKPTQDKLDATFTQFMSGGGPVYVRGCGPSVDPFRFPIALHQYKHMYIELDVPGRLQRADKTVLSKDRWTAAMKWSIAQVQGKLGVLGVVNADLSAVFRLEYETPFLFEIVHPVHYHRLRGAAFANFAAAANYQAYWQTAALIIYGTSLSDECLLNHFLRFLSGQASAKKAPTANHTRYSSPGIVIAPSIAASRLFWAPSEFGQVPSNIGNFAGCQATGIATRERAAAVFGGTGVYATWVYMPQGYTHNAMHEFGHTLYMRHQFTGGTFLHPANFREDHDSHPAANPNNVGSVYDRCLMGYLHCEGQFCGKCHLKLRGWDIHGLPV